MINLLQQFLQKDNILKGEKGDEKKGFTSNYQLIREES
jgi:hypothetical protein